MHAQLLRLFVTPLSRAPLSVVTKQELLTINGAQVMSKTHGRGLRRRGIFESVVSLKVTQKVRGTRDALVTVFFPTSKE